MTDSEPTSEEEHLLAEAEGLLERLRANPPMGGFGFEFMLCQFERDRRANEEILDQLMHDQVRARARFKEQLDAYHTQARAGVRASLPVPTPEGTDREGEPPADPQPA